MSFGTIQRLTRSVGSLPCRRAARLERALLFATIVAAAGLIWLAPRPPMVDLPQHAAQISLWRDLLLGRSAWSELVRINLLTPYLIGYGSTLPLAFVMPIETAVCLVLSAGLIAFVCAALALRRRFGGDPRLDWLFPVGWFGFAWQWGFFTFLVATPVALVFLVVVHRAIEQTSLKRQTVVVAVGGALLLAHGLLFAAFLPIGAALALFAARGRRLRGAVGLLWPFVLLVLLCGLFRFLSARVEGTMQFDRVLFGSDLWLKPIALLLYVTDTSFPAGNIGLALTIGLLLTPALLGCRLNTGPALVPFAALITIVLAMPSYAFQTALLFHRFAVFILPFYALMFSAPCTAHPERRTWAGVLPMLITWLVLGIQASRMIGFAAEARDFEPVLAAAEPNRRALALVFETGSPAAANTKAYLHMPLWYQADKGGFVDFNFAGFHPQIVRFRPGNVPTYNFSKDPDTYDGSRAHAALYDYVFVRGSAENVGHVIGVSACPLHVKTAVGRWTLLERGSCPPS